MKKTQYYVVDIVKFAMCLLIVAGHSVLFEHWDSKYQYWVEKGLLRVAVPFFFITSGFLLGSKAVDFNNIAIDNNNQLKKFFIRYSKRLLVILLFFEPVSLILVSINLYVSNMSFTSIIGHVLASIIFDPYGALWFIQACLVGIWILYFFIKNDKVKLIAPAAILCYAVGLLGNCYFFLIENSKAGNLVARIVRITMSRNGITVGFPLLALGFLVAYLYKTEKIKINLWLLTGLTYFAVLAECNFLHDKKRIDDGSLFITVPIFAAILLLACLRYKTDKNYKFCILLRNLSTGMYLTHRPVLYVMEILGKTTEIKISYPAQFVITLALSASLCLLSYRSKNKFISNLLK